MRPFYLHEMFLLCVGSTFEPYRTVISVGLALPGLALIILSRKKSLITTPRSRMLMILLGAVLLLLGINMLFLLTVWCR
jgi:hypothetical protein